MTLPELTNGIIGFAAFVVAVGILHIAGRGLYRLTRRVEDTFKLVHKELTPNGGSSLHDAIKRIDARVEVPESVDRRNDLRRDGDHADT